MIKVLSNSWALLLGICLLMLGNGLQGTLLGVRGGLEGFTTFQMSIVMSAYFVGFLAGSKLTPIMLQRVGHVRVFAALASMISAILVLYAEVPNWIAWSVLRVLIGVCFSGVYITAESWLNNTATNETRGQTLSLYMITQMVGIISAQGLLNFADPRGYTLFVVASVLISFSFAPILLSVSSAPSFATTKSMSLRRLYEISPLGCVGIFLMGGIFSALFGMAAIWGGMIELTVFQISVFVACVYLGGLIFQYPIGWLSDRMDRRRLIVTASVASAVVAFIAAIAAPPFWALATAALIIGGFANPVYGLLLAHTNDFLEPEDMAGASGGLLFINGLGSIMGPLTIGWLLDLVGPWGFFYYLAVLNAALAAYGIWRMRQRVAPTGVGQGGFAPLTQGVSAVTVEAAMEVNNDDTSGASSAKPASL